jgi:uncharacterized protein with von Willebrand factor type A (vWA) domain
MKTGIELIAEERQEQLIKHSHSVESDAIWNINGELMEAVEGLIHHKYGMMPDDWDQAIVAKMLSKSYKDRLVIAGALIAAEIDRLNLDTKQQPG